MYIYIYIYKNRYHNTNNGFTYVRRQVCIYILTQKSLEFIIRNNKHELLIWVEGAIPQPCARRPRSTTLTERNGTDKRTCFPLRNWLQFNFGGSKKKRERERGRSLPHSVFTQLPYILLFCIHAIAIHINALLYRLVVCKVGGR